MKPTVHAGRLERRVRLVSNETMPGVHEFCMNFALFFHSAQGAIRGEPLLRPALNQMNRNADWGYS